MYMSARSKLFSQQLFINTESYLTFDVSLFDRWTSEICRVYKPDTPQEGRWKRSRIKIDKETE